MSQLTHSGIYSGWVKHRRFSPKQHEFKYRMFLLAIDLDEMDQLETVSPWLKRDRFAPMALHRKDYLQGKGLDKDVVWQKVQELGGEPQARVLFVGQPRCFGIYFSPINLYYCFNDENDLVYLLAEVSNTPWNQRHYYLVNAPRKGKSENIDKAFHVSPFMEMDMQYRWRFNSPDKQLDLLLENWAQERVFDASLNMQRSDLNRRTLRNTICRLPSMTLKTVAGIYWQALKIWIKRVPFIGHPSKA
ncbi:DUF1365 domain-containing protein [Paraferrimonas sedimenticola]|uniref:DUF1365 domain-containing protein n=1 Tax=Paraferrimonas sedimenticola TaxID=375674 RepID=A0AA37RXI6_9GAMM|nr:DUF1365 domain-containing protein [Paraferrimonas sedimenticola]GLP96961.1 DUF1365 domain-containing protein [Paraferrimonas sedimenticola]